MTAGLPSAGIGGLFYLIGALMMPLKELVAAVRQPGVPRQWRLALGQAAIAVGILVGLWLTGLGLGYVIRSSSMRNEVFGRVLVLSGSTNAIRFIMLVMSLGLLTTVLSAVQVIRFAVRRRTQPIEQLA
jgi:F0F1-type ATP synthase membrane subunit c/vacuolar-type H+-ATPase subunit K